MQALLEVKKGEKLYKSAISQWLRDEDGALVFRVISKKRLDGQIELVCYTLRADGIKRVIQHISFAESDFWGIMEALDESMKEFFPDIKFEVQNIDMADTESYRVMKNTRLNVFYLKAATWIESKINSFLTFIRKR